jgi:hypothetical protein
MRKSPEEIRTFLEDLYARRREEVRKNMIDFGDLDPYVEASNLLGYPGAMLSGSKQAAPERNVVWNGNVFANKMKIWFGDISITEKTDELQTLANTLGVKIYVLREHDGRFDNEANPLLDQAVATFEPVIS